MFKGLKSLLAGLVGGAALGILFAPKKGEELRKDLKKEVDSGGTGLDTVRSTVVGMGKEIGESCKTCSGKVASSKEYKEGRKKVEKVISKARKTLKKRMK
ncbi:MAG: YtxH domain-containing protein [Candidatus Peregrinibacteria bacterium]